MIKKNRRQTGRSRRRLIAVEFTRRDAIGGDTIKCCRPAQRGERERQAVVMERRAELLRGANYGVCSRRKRQRTRSSDDPRLHRHESLR